MTGTSSHSQRRHIRYAIELPAELIGHRQGAMPCLIVDFCMGGFFLEMQQADAAVGLFESRENVRVRFRTVQQRLFEVDANIVHLAPSGLGVAVENMPPLAFSALLDEAHLGEKPARANPPQFKASEVQSDAVAEFPKRFRTFLAGYLDGLINGFLGAAKHDLEQLNLQSAYFANQSLLDDFVSLVMESRRPISESFCETVCFQVDYLNEKFHSKDSDALSVDSSQLSLVEKDAFEDWLNMSAIIRRLNNRFEEPVNQITRELARILGTFSAEINNPVRPSVLCDSFRESIQRLELTSQSNLLLYRAFEANLNAYLDAFYQQTTEFLKNQVSHQKTSTKPPSERSRNSAVTDPAAFAFDNDNILPIEFDMSLFPDPEPEAVMMPAKKTARPRLRHQPSVAKVSGKLLDIISELSAAADESAPEAEDDAFYPLEDILNALMRIQHNLALNPPDNSEPSGFQQRLEALLATADNKTKALAARERSRIAVSEQFFQALNRNPYLSPLLKDYFKKIQLPLLVSSLEGNDFLDDDRHPARDVMNQLALLENALKSNKVVKTIRVRDTVDRLMDKIVRESDANPGVFNEVANELKWLASEVAKSQDVVIGRIIEAYEGRQKLELARHTVQQAINQRLCGWRVPSVIPALLDAGWQQLLVIAELTAHQRSDEKQLYWTVLDNLMDWLAESDAVLTIKTSAIQQTIETVADKLKSILADAGERNRVVEELTAVLIGVGEPRVRRSPATMVYEPPRSALADAVQVRDAFALQVEQLKTGEWLSIGNDSGGFDSMKLVWVGDFLKCYVFVNSDGLNKREFSAIELAEAFRHGRAKSMQNLEAPLVERATEDMLQSMHDNVVASAVRDPLTEALTHDEFIRQVKNDLAKLDSAGHTLCHLELLDFRVITNVCGSEGGDALAKTIADWIKSLLKPADSFGRLGEKSFSILFKDSTLDAAKDRLQALIDRLAAERFHWAENSYAIAVSAGLVFCGEGSDDCAKLMQQADSASLSAKELGRNQVVVYSQDDEKIKRQASINEWIGRIDRILAENRLFTRCQKIASIQSGQSPHEHYEILLGIRDENGQIMPPDVFIPAVERCKRMPEIDRWVIEDVLRWIETHSDMFGYCDGFSINLSGQSVNSEAFLAFLTAKLESVKNLAEKLTFEITETIASENIAFTVRFIETVKKFGCKFSLDDFGSGYSSYAYLKNLQVDFLKIDGAFVKDLASNKADIAIVKSMNEIGHSLGMQTIAEYVENAEIQSLLSEIGVDYGQGYHIHKPIPLADLNIEAPRPLYMFEDDSFWEI